MKKKIHTLEDLVRALEFSLDIPKDHHIVAVFENDNSEKIIGWAVVKNNQKEEEVEYPIYSEEELIAKFKKQDKPQRRVRKRMGANMSQFEESIVLKTLDALYTYFGELLAGEDEEMIKESLFDEFMEYTNGGRDRLFNGIQMFWEKNPGNRYLVSGRAPDSQMTNLSDTVAILDIVPSPEGKIFDNLLNTGNFSIVPYGITREKDENGNTTKYELLGLTFLENK